MNTNTGYENSPACQLLATACAACGRPLVDSLSVETGMGPICREKYGYNLPGLEGTRAAANALVHRVAAEQCMTAADAAELVGLGFGVLALKLADRLTDAGTVTVTRLGDRLAVVAPYRAEATPAWRKLRGRRWDGATKANTVPATERKALWALLCEFYHGGLCVVRDVVKPIG